MSYCDRAGVQVDPDELQVAEGYTPTVEAVGAIVRAILRDSEHPADERVHLVGVLLELADLAGLRDAS